MGWLVLGFLSVLVYVLLYINCSQYTLVIYTFFSPFSLKNRIFHKMGLYEQLTPFDFLPSPRSLMSFYQSIS